MILQVVITTFLTQNLGFEDQQKHRCLIAAQYMIIAINAAFYHKCHLRCPYLVSASSEPKYYPNVGGLSSR